MPVHEPNPHGTTVYAPPVTCRAASPTSSIGTQYDDDATEDSEMAMSALEFERMCEDKIRIWEPRPEEEIAEREVLVTDRARNMGGEAEQALFERILRNLRAEISRLDDEEIYERALLKGSQIGLEAQPPTTDIDKIMRSMMGPALNLGYKAPPPDPITGEIETQPLEDITDGPWSNYGQKPTTLPRHLLPAKLSAAVLVAVSPTNSVFAPGSSASIATATTTTPPTEDMVVDTSSSFLKNSLPAPGAGRIAMHSVIESNISGATVVGGKRTRNGQTRR